MKRKLILYIFISSFILALIRLVIIHHYVDWRFLWGGDQVPVLNLKQFLKSVFNLELPWRNLGILFIPQLSFTLPGFALGKVVSLLASVKTLSSNLPGWIVNTIWFFIGTSLLWYVISSFKYANEIHKLVSYIVLIVLFAFNPWATIDTFKSYLGATSLYAFLGFTLIAFYFRLIKNFMENENVNNYEVLYIIAISMILYGISPSASIRGSALLLELEIFFIVFLILAYYLKKKTVQTSQHKVSVRKVIATSLIPLIISISYSAFYLLTGYLSPLKERVISRWGALKPPTQILYPSYANILNSFIGMTSWVAHSGYMPYHSLYEKGLIAGLTLLWPLLGLGGLILITFRYRYLQSSTLKIQFSFLLALGIVSLAWGTALHPPFGLLKWFLISRIPLIVKVLPWGVNLGFIKFVYLIAISYITGYLFIKATQGFKSGLILRTTNFAHLNNKVNTKRRLTLIILVLLLIFLLLYTSLPIFMGQVFGQYYNEDIKGFNIPKDYRILYKLNTSFYEHVLLLPLTPTYTSTSWGWQGSIGWYHGLNNAILTYTFAPYSEYTEWRNIYQEAARPCLKIIGGSPITQYINIKKVKVWNGRVTYANILNDGSLNLSAILFKGEHTDIILPFKRVLNISMYKALEIDLTIKGNNSIIVSPWLFIYSGNVGGAHILPAIRIPGNITKVYAVGVPDKPWPASKYDPSRVTGLILRIRMLNAKSINSLLIKVNLKVAVSNSFKLCGSYMQLLKLLNIKYVIMDKSLQNYNFFFKLVNDAMKRNFSKAYSGIILDIYNTNVSTFPLYIVKPNDVSVKILEERPSHIKAELILSNNVSNIVLTVPMLYSESLPNPLKVSAYSNNKSLKVKPLDYKGLRGYSINTLGSNEVVVDIRYVISFKALYMTFLTLSISPLALLLAGLILYLMKLRDRSDHEY